MLPVNFWLILKNPHKSGLRFLDQLSRALKSFFVSLFCVRLAFSFVVLMSFPITASADIISFISGVVYSKTATVYAETNPINSQNMPIFQAVRTSDPNWGRGGGDITIVGGTALLSESGPIGTMADVSDGITNETISIYVVKKGDNLSTIAEMFNVSVNTIVWANNINGSVIREGQTLIILPISGVEHTVKKGDTLSSIAKLYKADINDISSYNNITSDQKLAVGDVIIIPDGEISSPVTRSITASNPLRGASALNYDGYYMRPIVGGARTQGLHGYNGVDLATYQGAPIYASAGGTVIVAATGGWNGGYGNYIVISHPNGTQTLYGHALKVTVSAGEQVVQGQIIGLVGSTGKSTGPHLHFEVRGAKNPFGP